MSIHNAIIRFAWVIVIMLAMAVVVWCYGLVSYETGNPMFVYIGIVYVLLAAVMLKGWITRGGFCILILWLLVGITALIKG